MVKKKSTATKSNLHFTHKSTSSQQNISSISSWNFRSFVCYLTIVGWLIARFFMKPQDEELESFHFRQALGLHAVLFI